MSDIFLSAHFCPFFRAYAAYEDGIEVNPEIEHDQRKVLAEYVEKLNIGSYAIPDPLEVEHTSWISEATGIYSWPSLYYHDIAKYLNHLAPLFLSRLESEYKLGKAYRYFSCDFVREVFYFDIVNTDLCLVKCKVLPSQRLTSSKPYSVWGVIRKDLPEKPGGEILSAYCMCTAGLHGSCNHVVAIFFRVECAVATGATRPSTTSMSCQWTIPSGSKITLKPTKAEQLYFTKNKYTKSNKTIDNKQKEAKQQFNSYKSSLHKKHLHDLSNVKEIRAKLFGEIGGHIGKSCLAEVMCGKQKTNTKTYDIPPSLPSSLTHLTHLNPSDYLNHLQMSQVQCDTIEKMTRTQSINPLWYEQRKGRITASKFYRVCTRAETTIRKKNVDVSNLVSEIMGYKKPFQTIAMKHGLATEPHAKRKLMEVLKEQKHTKVGAEEAGLK